MKLPEIIYNILDLKGVGKVKTNSILTHLTGVNADKDYDSSEFALKLSAFLDKDQVNSVFSNNNANYNKAVSNGVKFTTYFESNYPEELRKLDLHRPPVISYMGNIDLIKKKSIGFCGSRKASDKGLDVAKDITQQVVLFDVSVVSGYATGIDQQAHYWALKEGGSTIIVLPEGINSFRIKSFVKEVWDWNRVLVISEYNPGAIWSAGRAMERNGTIISLSNLMILIEAKDTGGSIDAGYKTLAMKKPLFAPVYDGMPTEAKGNEILLGKGARPIGRMNEPNKANITHLLTFLNLRIQQEFIPPRILNKGERGLIQLQPNQEDGFRPMNGIDYNLDTIELRYSEQYAGQSITIKYFDANGHTRSYFKRLEPGGSMSWMNNEAIAESNFGYILFKSQRQLVFEFAFK